MDRRSEIVRPHRILRSVFAVAVTIVVAAAVGCADRPSGNDPVVDRAPPNIVIFLVDTLRADRLGLYGYDRRPTSPRLDELASEAVVFEQAYSSAPWTLPTLASMATSTYSCEHGVVDDRRQLPWVLQTVAERLVDRGYLTMGLYGNAYAGPSFGLDRGFEHYTFSRQNDAKKVASLLDVAASEDRPFLLYIHNMEPHGGERFQGPPQPGFSPMVDREQRREMLDRFNAYRKLTRVDFARRRPLGTTDNTEAQRRELEFMDAHLAEHDVLYDAAVRLADRRFGSVVDLLRERGMWNDTLLVFLADHGEELGEHGGWQHDQSVYEELIHVPLVVRFPGGEYGGGRVDSVVSLVDVAPTLIAAAGGDPEGSPLIGRDLARLVGAASETVASGPKVVAIRDNRKKYYAPWKASRGDLNIAVRDGVLKAILNVEVGSVELYDLEVDPGETTDLAAQRPDDATRLGAFAADWLAGCAGGAEAGTSELDEATLERLRSLGYVD